MQPPPLLAAVALCAALAACQGSAGRPAAPPPGLAPPGVTPSGFVMPEGAGCAGDIARFRAVLANDVAVGHLTQGVFNRASQDTNRADAACSAGRDGEARAALAAVKGRYGYP